MREHMRAELTIAALIMAIQGGARERASSIIPIAAASLGSNGRRNTLKEKLR